MSGVSRFALVGLMFALLAGAALRLSFPNDIEYKQDEAGYVEASRTLIHDHSWPSIGPATSTGSPSPGLGLGLVALLTFVSDAETPPQIARTVQLTNVVALLLLAIFAFAVVPSSRREYWLWAIALWAVNVVAVFIERKIWPVSLTPIFTVALIATWWHRHHVLAAFAWGLLGALIAQVHLSEAAFVIALAAWTLATNERGIAWRSWFAGSLVGSLAAVPWFLAIFNFAADSSFRWRWPIPLFFTRWFTQPFGLAKGFELQSDEADFFRSPALFGHDTDLINVIFVLLWALFVFVVAGALRRLWTSYMTRSITPDARGIILGNGDPESLLIRAALIGYGGLVTFQMIFGGGIYRHYMTAVVPIMALSATLLVFFSCGTHKRLARGILVAACIAQAAFSFGMLQYVHEKQIIHGEFGPTWRSQQANCAREDIGHSPCLEKLYR
jgi:hypothetical protein